MSITHRVVVTGLGIVSPVGNDVSQAWDNISNGVSGIAPITRYDPTGFEVRIAAEVKNFDGAALFGHREVRRLDRVMQYGLAAAQQALADARLDLAHEDCYRVGCVVGSCIGGIETLLSQQTIYDQRGPRAASPLLLPMVLPDSIPAQIAMAFNLRGPNMSMSTACATSNNAIGEAAEMLRRGRADVIVTGGAEAAILPLPVASMNNMTALSRRNDDPAAASRPFDATRDGFVIGEGTGILVLETLEHAQARGARIYAEVLGYGSTDDAYHITAPDPEGASAAAAMRIALEDAGLKPEDLDYINAHGTSTQLNDASETKAIKRALGEAAYHVVISSTKSMTGHLLGAAGAIEAIFSVKAIECQFIPPTINLHTPDPECDLDYTPNHGRPMKVDTVMSNGFGFGGHNAVLVFGKPDRR